MAIVKTFKAARGSLLTDDDAEALGSYLEETFPDGARPDEILDDAISNDSPFCEYLEWNDTVAGYNYRLDQVRKLTRSILVVEHQADGTAFETRAFQSVVRVVEKKTERIYVPQEVIWQTDDYAAQVIAKALEELRGWTVRYKNYEELYSIASTIQSALEGFETDDESDDT